MDTAGLWLTADQRQRAYDSGTLFMRCHLWLAHTCFEKRVLNWKLRPKWHFIAHTVWAFSYSALNPRFQHCFADEDMMGKIARLARKTSKQTVVLRTIQRYMLNMWDRLFVQRRKRSTQAKKASVRWEG